MQMQRLQADEPRKSHLHPKHLATILYMLKEGESLPSVANQAADQAVPAFSM